MKSFNTLDFNNMERLYRINLINSASGFKSANLIGTKSKSGHSNVAIISSVIHLGSDPALLGFVSRPVSVRRNTYDNIKETGIYTINHVHEGIIEDAHHTSAKYDALVSEFSMTNLKEEYKSECDAPFVKGAPVQIKMKFLEEVKLKLNGTIMIIGEIQKLFVEYGILKKDGLINLTEGKVVAINGLDHYTLPQSKKRLPYQRPKITNQLVKES
ncbi:flavin reductase family protein [Lutimonas zeaxanthinifaciens]|uniref:flavin reductase family protein n=1 Tax=Lutimonas zeaxanthinifaciens TaxID=3060215 RepID=UPI00265C8F46|nr:flavin reductase [Lutimonas sp. YSD2104]WKK64655.1 flavin reductase [Lutimonas sp. YSD2104]